MLFRSHRRVLLHVVPELLAYIYTKIKDVRCSREDEWKTGSRHAQRENTAIVFSLSPYRGMYLLTLTPDLSFFSSRSALFMNTSYTHSTTSSAHITSPQKWKRGKRRTYHSRVLQQLAPYDRLPEYERVFEAVDVPVFCEVLVEAGDGREEEDGLDVVEVG